MIYILQIIRQHVHHFLRILIVVFVDVLLVAPDVVLEVFQQVNRHLREVDDIVHRVQDTVDETFCQFSYRRHLLMAYQFLLGIAKVGSTLLDNALQLDLVFFQFLQTEAEQQIDQIAKGDEVERHHIPAHQQRIGNRESDFRHFRQFAISQLCLYAQRVGAMRQIQELHTLLLAPDTPFVIIETVAVKRLSRQRGVVEGIDELQLRLVAS